MTVNSFWSKIYDNALKYPDRIIVYDAKKHWTWKQLLSLASKYAESINNYTRSESENKAIPILVDRTGNTIAAILGMILSGRAYAPLSTFQPLQRIKRCFSLLDADLFIDASGTYTQDNNPFNPIRCVTANVSGDTYNISEFTNIPLPYDTLYVLFTSGSTGEPKGVLANYNNIYNTILWSEDIIDWLPADIIGCATNLFFDISQFDLFTCLYFNVPFAVYSNPQDVNAVVEETGLFSITSVFSVPAFFSQLMRCEKITDKRMGSLRRIISGGDFFPAGHVLAWMKQRPDIKIYNVWGPTETSIVNTMHLITDKDIPLLSKGEAAPVGTSHIRMPFILLDENKQEIVSPDVKGEICMLGDCVTDGYLNSTTEESDSYFSLKGRRAFATKDIGWTDKEGNLYISGRKGSTIKISGYRIDMREVEKTAALYKNIYLSCAFPIELQPGLKELRLAVELKEPSVDLDIYQFKKHLRMKLPQYMVPKRVTIYDNMPKNRNGKIDRQSLILDSKTEVKAVK